MGYGLLPMMAGVAELAGRGITATVAAGKSSYIGTCLASPVAWIFASVLLWVMYFFVMKDMARKLYIDKIQRNKKQCHTFYIDCFHRKHFFYVI